ncbi:probable fatty acid-binding protein isoform X1 [Danaus plexippus]|nr:probable fatty acid-binding protein isoform X1 [Danaus plexippus]
MDNFLGKEYVMVSQENFDDYLVFMGVSYLNRKLAFSIKSIVCLIKNEDGTYSFIFKCKLATSNAKFIPGEKFIETKADGSKVEALITFEGNKMTHIQIESNGRTSTHLREFFPDRLIVTTTAKGFDKIVTRKFELVK